MKSSWKCSRVWGWFCTSNPKCPMRSVFHNDSIILLHIVILPYRTVKLVHESSVIHTIYSFLKLPICLSTFSICPIHPWVSPPCQVWSLQWLCCCCWAPAPAGLAGLLPAGRGRHRAAPAAAEPAAEGGPSPMSLWALHSEPAKMTYSAWSTDGSPHYWCGKVIEMFTVSPTLLMINLAGVLSPQNGRKNSGSRRYTHTCGGKQMRHSWYCGHIYTSSSPAPRFKLLNRSRELKG